MLVDEKVCLKIKMWIGDKEYDFSDRLLAVSDITKKIEERGGKFSSGDLNFELANEDGLFDEDGPLFAYNTWMNRPVMLSLILLEEGGKEVKLFGGYIQYKDEKEDGLRVEFKARELTKLWMDRNFVFPEGVTELSYPHDDWVPKIWAEKCQYVKVAISKTEKKYREKVLNNFVTLVFAWNECPEEGIIKFDSETRQLNFAISKDANGNWIWQTAFSVALNTNYDLKLSGIPGTKMLKIRTGSEYPTETLEEEFMTFETTLPELEWRSIDQPADIFWDLVVNHAGYKITDQIWIFIDEEVWKDSWEKLEQWSCQRTLKADKSYKILALLEELIQPFGIALYAREDGHVHFESYLECLDKRVSYVPYEWLTSDSKTFDVADLFNHIYWKYGDEEKPTEYSTPVYGQSYGEYRALRTLEISSFWLPANIDTTILDMLAYRIYAKYGRPLAHRKVELATGGLDVRLNDTLLIKDRLWKVLRFRKRPIPFRITLELVPDDELGIKIGYVSRCPKTHPNEIPTPQNIGDAFAQVCYPAYEGDPRVGFPEGKNYWERMGYEVA